MVNYWCRYIEVNKDENHCIEVGYRSLEGLITDLLEDITNKESSTLQYKLRDKYSHEFVLNKADYTN